MKCLLHLCWAFAMLAGSMHDAVAGADCPKPKSETNVPIGAPLSVDEGQGRMRMLYEESHALLIGQSRYEKGSGWRDLYNVPAELDLLGATLEKQGFHIVRHDNLRAAELAPAIDCFVRTYGYRRDARVLIYFAGHGYSRLDRQATGVRTVGYILPVDSPPEPKNIGSTEDTAFVAKAVRLTQFQEWATAMEARHVLMIFDSCFSGSILGHRGGDLASQKPQPLNYILSDVAQSPVRWFLTAGSATQKVPDQSYFNSLLVQALTGARREADVNRDGFLTATELVNFLKGTVPGYNSGQTPGDGKLNDPMLNVGDVTFRLPDRQTAAIIAWAATNPDDLPPPPPDADRPTPISLPASDTGYLGTLKKMTVALPPAPAVIGDADQAALAQAIQEIESDDTKTRRKARTTLSTLIDKNGPAFVGELVRGLPLASYRFQLGVADALAKSPKGWSANDQKTALDIVRSRAATSRDATLKQALNGALRNAN